MTTVRTARLELVTALSTAQFTVSNFGLNSVTGSVPITNGWVEVDASGAPVAIHASLDLGSIDTGNARRDHDLRKPSLLDLDHHPTLVFTGRPQPAYSSLGSSTLGSLTHGWTVDGTIEAHDASTPITLTATSVEGPDGATTVHAHGEFDRRDLGVRAPRAIIGRRVRVRLEVTFARTL